MSFPRMRESIFLKTNPGSLVFSPASRRFALAAAARGFPLMRGTGARAPSRAAGFAAPCGAGRVLAAHRARAFALAARADTRLSLFLLLIGLALRFLAL